jgi:hypothetical protein
MDLDSELAHELERAIPHLPTAPASSRLSAGRRARRRRNTYVGVASVAVLALTTGAAVSALSGSIPTGADHVSDTPSPSSTEIPSWAQEYGNHGPVSIYPDGRLWVAPDARLIKTVENPLGLEHEDVVSSYAVEAEMDGEVDWVLVYRDSDADAVFGEMGHPGEWTNDFEMWIDDVTSNTEDRASLSERLVHFAGDGSERLVAGAGAVIVDQTGDVVLPNWEEHPGIAVAEVTFEGTTWFVLAMDPAHRKPFYMPYEGSVVSASTLDGFVDFLRADGTDK